MGYPIRKSPDQRLFAPTRGLSQLITSFIVSMCLGIPRTPLVALPKCFYLEDDLATLNHRTGWFNLSNFQIVKKLKNLWSWQGLNLRPPECKSGALPTELQPHNLFMTADQVGLRGLEPRTSSLSGMRSNHLSYKPKIWYGKVMSILGSTSLESLRDAP